MIRGIIFDLDGTLVDTLADLAAAMNRLLRRDGYPVHPVEDYRYFVGRGILNTIRYALPEEEKNRISHRGRAALAALPTLEKILKME